MQNQFSVGPPRLAIKILKRATENQPRTHHRRTNNGVPSMKTKNIVPGPRSQTGNHILTRAATLHRGPVSRRGTTSSTHAGQCSSPALHPTAMVTTLVAPMRKNYTIAQRESAPSQMCYSHPHNLTLPLLMFYTTPPLLCDGPGRHTSLGNRKMLCYLLL